MMVGDPVRVGRWCLRVPAESGETHRRELIRNGLLDRTLRPRREGGALLLPLLTWQEGAEQCLFDSHPDRPALPRHELIGGIAVMHEHDPAGAELILASRPNLHTVLFPESDVEGEFRTKRFAVLAGRETTRTVLVEHGHRFAVDLAAAYFSARLATERRRIASLLCPGELVLDMFAGVGPFAIALADRAAVVVAVDINPQAAGLLLENCVHNRVTNVLPILADAGHLPDILLWQFDRIVMNLPASGQRFLPAAFRLCRPGGMIHFYALVSREGEHGARIRDLGGDVLSERAVRSYSPAQWHAVYDIRKKAGIIRPVQTSCHSG